MSDPTEVFLITEGSYSDYHVVAAFLTKPEAEAYFLEVYGPEPDEAAVEEYPVGAPSDHDASAYGWIVCSLITTHGDFWAYWGIMRQDSVMQHPQGLSVVCCDRDKERAIKRWQQRVREAKAHGVTAPSKGDGRG